MNISGSVRSKTNRRSLPERISYLISDREKSKAISQLEGMTVRGKPVEYHIWDITRIYEIATSSMGREEIVIKLGDGDFI